MRGRFLAVARIGGAASNPLFKVGDLLIGKFASGGHFDLTRVGEAVDDGTGIWFAGDDGWPAIATLGPTGAGVEQEPTAQFSLGTRLFRVALDALFHKQWPDPRLEKCKIIGWSGAKGQGKNADETGHGRASRGGNS